MPWAWTKRRIARRWHCKPFEVNDAPSDEITEEIRIMNAEIKALGCEYEDFGG